LDDCASSLKLHPLLLGNIINGLNSNGSIIDAVSEQSINFCYMGLAALFTAFLQASVRFMAAPCLAWPRRATEMGTHNRCLVVRRRGHSSPSASQTTCAGST
jgi:hypothetical protein